MSKPNRKLISDLFVAYERGDREAMDSLLARDVVYHIPGRNQFSGDHCGPDAVIDLWDRQKEHLGGLPYHAEPYDVSVTDDHVIMLAHVSAQRGQTSYRFQTANVYRIADGKVAECWPHVFDLHAFDEFWSPGDPRHVARRWVDALSAHDLSAAAACFAEDYHDTAPARPGEEVHGRDRVRQNFAALFDGVPNLQAEILQSVADGNIVWMEWRMWGTRADGTTLNFVGVNLFCVEGDRFTWGRIYTDLVGPRGDIDTQIERMTSASLGREAERGLRPSAR